MREAQPHWYPSRSKLVSWVKSSDVLDSTFFSIGIEGAYEVLNLFVKRSVSVQRSRCDEGALCELICVIFVSFFV